jgi:uncharacterized protein (DUF2267 family)
MTVPTQYARASEEFEHLLDALRRRYDHATRHQTYQTLEGVLRVFRRRLTLAEGLRFADALPAVLRAIFVADWDIEAPVEPFADPQTLSREVKAYRINHNLTPDDAIAGLAEILAGHVDPVAFRRALETLPPEAAQFWQNGSQKPQIGEISPSGALAGH